MPTLLQLDQTVIDKVECDEIDNIHLYIDPHELHELNSPAAIQHNLLAKLKKRLLNRCTKAGFVVSNNLPGSSRADTAIEIVSREAGIAPPEHMNGSWLYRVCYRYTVCNPPIDVIIPTVVCSKNKMGMMTTFWPFCRDTTDADDAQQDSSKKWCVKADQMHQARLTKYLVILLPKALHTDAATARAYADYESHMETDAVTKQGKPVVRVKILQKKFDINDKQISAVGVLVPDDDVADGER